MKKFQGGGGVPRQTTIGGQRHDLAYINPFEADLLRAYGGSGEPGPGGVPAYRVYNRSYNPSTISKDKSQSSSYESTQASESAADNRPAASFPSFNTETAAEAKARMDAAPNQGPTPAQAAAAQIAAAQAGQAAFDARGEPGKAAAAAAAEKVGAPMTSTERQQEIAARVPTYSLDEASPDGVLTPAPIAPAPEVVYQGLRPSARPSVAVPQGGLGDLTNLLGMIPGVPMFLNAAKGAVGDIMMTYDAGLFNSREEQRRSLQEARNPDGSRKYSDFEIDEYFLITDETAERAKQQGGGASDDSMPYTLPASADPCPEGYRMDTVTNMCVPADDVTGGTPPPVVPGFPDLTRPDPVAVPTVVGSSGYTQMPALGGLPPLLPGTGNTAEARALPMPDFGGINFDNRRFMPTTYGGMPTDVDPFR